MGFENNQETGPIIDTEAMKMPVTGKIHHSHLGPILGVLLILLVIVGAGLYIWGGMLFDTQPVVETQVPVIPNNEPETPRAEADQQILETLSPSNEIDAIEADVMSTNLDSIDTDLNLVDQELNNALPAE